MFLGGDPWEFLQDDDWHAFRWSRDHNIGQKVAGEEDMDPSSCAQKRSLSKKESNTNFKRIFFLANKRNNFSLCKGALGPRAQLYLSPDIMVSVPLLIAGQISNTNTPVRGTEVCHVNAYGDFPPQDKKEKKKVEKSARGSTAKKILSKGHTPDPNS